MLPASLSALSGRTCLRTAALIAFEQMAHALPVAAAAAAQEAVPVATSPSAPAPDDEAEPFHLRKRIAVLGARGVGKSALSIRCALGRFEPDYMPTFEDMYEWKPVVDGLHYDLCIVDTDGQDEHSFFGLQYTIGIDGYILMFSVRDESSFDVIKAVNDKLLATLNVRDTKGVREVPRILVGNQIDITHERQITFETASEYANEQGIPYMECSAFTPHNAENVFKAVLRIIQNNLRESHLMRNVQNAPDKTLPEPNPQKQTCCVQ